MRLSDQSVWQVLEPDDAETQLLVYTAARLAGGVEAMLQPTSLQVPLQQHLLGQGMRALILSAA